MEYLNLVLRLGEWNPATSTGIAEVSQSPAGQSERYPFVLEVDWEACNQRIHRTSAMAEALGRKLAESVFSPESLMLWRESYQIARERKRGLRLRLQIDSWELARLPWEMLYDTQRSDFMVFDPRVSLVRYLRLHAAPPVLRQSSSFKVMVVVASPNDLPTLQWQREVAVLDDALRELAAEKHVEVLHCTHATSNKLQMALLDNAPDVVHYIGHAQYDQDEHQGFLFLEDDAGAHARWSAGDAAHFFKRYGVNLVVLNACETANGAWAGLAPALVRTDIPAVVAMQWPVDDQAAIRFSQLFYKALSLGRTIDECVAEGRLSCSATQADPNDWAAPVLFLRSANGRLWVNDVGTPEEKKPLLVAPEGVVQPVARSPQPAVPVSKAFHFRTRGPLLAATDGAELIDRAELRRGLRLAQQPSVTQYVALLGARQTGKTTLLLRLRDLLQDSYACVVIDLSVMRQQDARACFRYLAFCLANEMRDLFTNGTRFPETYPIEGAVEFVEFLRSLAASSPTPRIVVMLDEVGALSPEVSDTFFNTLRTVFTQGRALNNQLAKYLFVFSGAVDLYALTFGTISPLNICEKIYLQDLELADVRTIVGQFGKLDVRVAPGTAERVYEWAGGHPYLTMRLCALMETAGLSEVTPQAVDDMAGQMLVEDDNILHVIHELDKRPAERRKLHAILLEGSVMPFSRNDAVLAALEMIGAIRAMQPPVVRNRLYERALRAYFATQAALPPAAEVDETVEAMYARLQTLRREALEVDGTYRGDKSWEVYAASLFSLIPAFSIYPVGTPDETSTGGLRLAVNSQAPGGRAWSNYGPLVHVMCAELEPERARSTLDALLEQVAAPETRLVLVMTAGRLSAAEERKLSAARGQVTLVLIDDREIATLLEQRQDLDAWLRNQVLEARLQRV